MTRSSKLSNLEPKVARRVALGALLFAASGCGKLIGIEDTEVTRSDASAGSSASGSTSSGGSSASAGASEGGGTSAGNAGSAIGDAGSGAVAGASAGGPSGGDSNGGQSNAGSSGNAGSGGQSHAGSGGSGGSAGSSGSAGSGCPCAAPTPTCENGKCIVRGPEMTKVSDYYIDSTEVTAAQYKAFLTAKSSDVSGQRADCTWNRSYEPAQANTNDAKPVDYVDFCDALAYCAWADKKLCGAIGGGALNVTDVTAYDKSQWYRACSGINETLYPYGNTFVKDNCSEDGFVSVPKSYPKCEGGYPGIWDMVGNVFEWVDACTGAADATGECEVMGGSTEKPGYRCNYETTAPRSDEGYPVGFRCCSK